jgi:hypothetical protein
MVDPEEREAGVQGWSQLTRVLLGVSGIGMILVSALAFIGTLDCHA